MTWKQRNFKKVTNLHCSSPTLGLTPSLVFSESLESLPMVLSSMIAGCSLWPLWLEVSLPKDTDMFAALLLQLRKSLWPLMLCQQGQNHTWRQMFFQCCYPGSCHGFLFSPLQCNRAAALSTLWGWREWDAIEDQVRILRDSYRAGGTSLIFSTLAHCEVLLFQNDGRRESDKS